MATRTHVVVVDDLDGSEAAETVYFGLDGVEYEIDLSDENAAKLREAVAAFTGKARRVGGRRKRGVSARGGDEVSASAIRAWARDNGYTVPERGRVSADVKAAYFAAH